MSQINIKNLTFYYDNSQDCVFENVNLVLDTDWKLGLIGRNGRGKTTLLRLLKGELEYRGSITASVDFEYFPYTAISADGTAYDAVKDIAERWLIEKELNLLGVGDCLDLPFKRLSGGEQTKVLLAALFARPNGFLLIDEPTNHLDIEGRQVLGRYLSKKSGYILVSHDSSLLDSCTDHILSINRGDIELRKGNYSEYVYNKGLQDDFEIKQNTKLASQIDKLKEAAAKKANWADKLEKTKIGSGVADRGFVGHKSAKMMSSAKAMEKRYQKMADQKSQLLKNIENVDELKMFPLVYHSNKVVEAVDLAVRYGQKTVFKDLGFAVFNGERVALSGGNGCGKSSVLRLIAGIDSSYEGNLFVGSGLKISYVPQICADMCGSLTDYAQQQGIDYSLFLTVLKKLDLERKQFDKDISEFSQGQKKKTALAGSLCTKAHLYVWDEPLNYIDIFSRQQLAEMLDKYKPTMVFVEHDANFLQAVATKIIRL